MCGPKLTFLSTFNFGYRGYMWGELLSPWHESCHEASIPVDALSMLLSCQNSVSSVIKSEAFKAVAQYLICK
jgi:hypothetical protein